MLRTSYVGKIFPSEEFIWGHDWIAKIIILQGLTRHEMAGTPLYLTSPGYNNH